MNPVDAFAGLFKKSGGRRGQAAYQTQNMGKQAADATGVVALRSVRQDVKDAQWGRQIAKSGAAVQGTRNVQFGTKLGDAVLVAYNNLTEDDRQDVGISSGGTLIVQSRARKTLAQTYNRNPDYGTYQRLNALRFLQALSTLYSAFGRTLVTQQQWAKQNAYNRGSISKVNRQYSSQVQKARKITKDPTYANSQTLRKQAYDNAVLAYSKDPTPANLQMVYKTLGKLKFVQNARQLKDNIAPIIAFKQKAQLQREELRKQSRLVMDQQARLLYQIKPQSAPVVVQPQPQQQQSFIPQQQSSMVRELPSTLSQQQALDLGFKSQDQLFKAGYNWSAQYGNWYK